MGRERKKERQTDRQTLLMQVAVMLTTSHGRDMQVVSRSGGLESYNHGNWVLHNHVSLIEDPSSRQEHSLTDALMTIVIRGSFEAVPRC